MKAVKGIYEKGSVKFAESLSIEGPVDVLVVFGDETEATAQQSDIEADALLNELDAIAGSIEGESDSAHDIQTIRREMAERL